MNVEFWSGYTGFPVTAATQGTRRVAKEVVTLKEKYDFHRPSIGMQKKNQHKSLRRIAGRMEPQAEGQTFGSNRRWTSRQGNLRVYGRRLQTYLLVQQQTATPKW